VAFGWKHEIGRSKLNRILCTLLFLAGMGWGQAGNPTDQKTISLLVQQIQDLQQHDRDLEERIKVLEANQKMPASDPVPPASTVAAPPAIPATVSSLRSPLRCTRCVAFSGAASENSITKC